MPNILWKLLIFLQLFEEDADKMMNERSKRERRQRHKSFIKWKVMFRNEK